MTKIKIIAEIGQAHDGSIGILHSYIDAVATTGVDYIKFQTHIADAESSQFEPFRVPFSYEDKTRHAYWKRMEFNFEQWQGIKKHCDDTGLKMLCTPFSNAAVDLLENTGVQFYKVGSGDVDNHLLLEKLGRTKKPIMLSSGMSSFSELDKAVQILRQYDTELSVLQCTSMYPTPPEHVGLNVISEIKDRYKLPVGISDHSGTIFPGIASAVMGAELIEVHVVFDQRMFGPDSTSSLTISELKELVRGVRFIENALKHPIDKNDSSSFEKIRQVFGRSLAVNTKSTAGTVIDFGLLESRKPAGYGVPAENYKAIIGKRLIRDKEKYEFLNMDDIES
jgi:N,N'-diacetyllegionaminate synthase